MERFVVAKAYVAAYTDPIRFAAGDPVEVQKHDAEFPGWYWCLNQAGKAGWVHRSFLQGVVGMTVGTRAYDALELSVEVGAQGQIIERLDGWLQVALNDGRRGWLPAAHAALEQ